MKIPFAKIEIGQQFWFNRKRCEKLSDDSFVEKGIPRDGFVWFITHDAEFPEFEIVDSRIDEVSK